MQKLTDALQREIARVEALREELECRPIPDVEGRLEISNAKKAEYYWVRKDVKTGKRLRRYIPPAELDLARQLAEKAYLSQLAKVIEKRVSVLKEFQGKLSEGTIEACYTKLSPARQRIVRPLAMPRAMKQRLWMTQVVPVKPFTPTARSIETELGERVRSKSEKIIADSLHHQNIPYKYEKTLFLDEEHIYNPDFTFYNLEEDVEIYWEHFGMMDDAQYCQSTLEKIEQYELHGIHMGERLFVTFESATHSLNFRHVEALIRTRLKGCVLLCNEA